MQNDIPSKNTLKHVSPHAGFTECHKTSVPLHSEQVESSSRRLSTEETHEVDSKAALLPVCTFQ